MQKRNGAADVHKGPGTFKVRHSSVPSVGYKLPGEILGMRENDRTDDVLLGERPSPTAKANGRTEGDEASDDEYVSCLFINIFSVIINHKIN
nr:unnamed protein product [Callosobruchus analis]